MAWRLFPQTNLTELQRVVNMCVTRNQEFDHDSNDCKRRTTELENSLRSLTERHKNEIEQLEQQFLSKEKELSDVFTRLQNERISENWNLKTRNQDLESSNKEITKRYEKKEEEVLHYATGLKELEIEHQATLKSLKTRLSEEESKNKELEKTCRESQDDLEYYLSRLSQEESNSKELQEECVYYRNSYQELRTNFNAYVKGKEAQIEQEMEHRMSRKDDELGKLREELKDKTERLASIFQRRLKQDQRKVENAVEFNTPSDVEKDFKYFLDGPRIDACETMENTLSPGTDIDTQIRYLACIIFVTAYEQVKEAREAMYDLFNNITRQLIDEAPRKSQELCIKKKEEGCSSTFPVLFEVSVERKENEDTRDIVDSLMLSLKQTAHLCDLKCFEKDVKHVILRRWTNCLHEEQDMPLLPALSEEVITEVDDYIKACIRLSWKIVTQVPPLRLEYRSLTFNKRMHSLTRLHCNNERSEQGQSENIACYLWPALVEHGGRVIFRGEVLCK